MTNVTLSIEKQDLIRARIIALQRGTSLNAVIREFVSDYVGQKDQYKQLTDKILLQAKNSTYSSEKRKWSREELYDR